MRDIPSRPLTEGEGARHEVRVRKYEDAQAGAPMTLWVTLADPEDVDEAAMAGLYIQASCDDRGAVEYVRRDVCDAWMAEAVQLGSESAAELLLAAVKRRRGPTT